MFFLPDRDIRSKRIFFEEPKKVSVKGTVIQYDGVPFTIKDSVRMECQHGIDRHIRARQKKTNVKDTQKEQVIHVTSVISRLLLTSLDVKHYLLVSARRRDVVS